MTEKLDAVSAGATLRKPRLALLIATCGGLGYLPVAPGTWGSLGGLMIYALTQFLFPPDHLPGLRKSFEVPAWSPKWAALAVTLVVAIGGVWASSRAAQFLRSKDPPCVVIDEVSGQHLTLLLGGGLGAAISWKYLLLGFILFRVFDTWKPYPAWRAEALQGGWGIMADDWIAGIYAAIGLWIARLLG